MGIRDAWVYDLASHPGKCASMAAQSAEWCTLASSRESPPSRPPLSGWALAGPAAGGGWPQSGSLAGGGFEYGFRPYTTRKVRACLPSLGLEYASISTTSAPSLDPAASESLRTEVLARSASASAVTFEAATGSAGSQKDTSSAGGGAALRLWAAALPLRALHAARASEVSATDTRTPRARPSHRPRDDRQTPPTNSLDPAFALAFAAAGAVSSVTAGMDRAFEGRRGSPLVEACRGVSQGAAHSPGP